MLYNIQRYFFLNKLIRIKVDTIFISFMFPREDPAERKFSVWLAQARYSYYIKTCGNSRAIQEETNKLSVMVWHLFMTLIVSHIVMFNVN